jgi:hypothetical protein
MDYSELKGEAIKLVQQWIRRGQLQMIQDLEKFLFGEPFRCPGVFR